MTTGKKIIVLFIFILGMKGSLYSQEMAPLAPAGEIQPMMLIENKITFYSLQIDFESVKIETMGESATYETLPSIIISPDNSAITLDFSACAAGYYVISGTRGELALQYLIEHKK